MPRTRRRLQVSTLAAILLAVAAAPAAAAKAPQRQGTKPQPPGPSVQAVMTSANLSWRLSRLPDLKFRDNQPSDAAVVTVDDRTRYQRFTGVGAAMTDSSAWLIYDELSPGARARLMNALFGPSGIHVEFVRVPIGASDFTAGGVPYSYDDLPPGQVDPTLAHFSIAHDLAYVVPALTQMLSINPHVELLAEPWSPPAWMKTNDAFDNLTRNRVAAQHLSRFVRAVHREVHPGLRERGHPDRRDHAAERARSPTQFPGLNLSAANEAQFITQYLEPALSAAGLHTKIYGLDRGALLYYAKSLALGPARDDLGGIAWHCYGGPSYMDVLHALAPTLDQIVSECSPGIIPYTAAEALISSLRNWASAAALWNLALDPNGGPVQQPNSGAGAARASSRSASRRTPSLSASTTSSSGRSRSSCQPGAVRIASNALVIDFRDPAGVYGVTPGLDDVAFRNPDGTTVLVTYNNSESSDPLRGDRARTLVRRRNPAGGDDDVRMEVSACDPSAGRIAACPISVPRRLRRAAARAARARARRARASRARAG